jgi:hypothetical protein
MGIEAAPGSDLERRSAAFDVLADRIEAVLDMQKLDAIIEQG